MKPLLLILLISALFFFTNVKSADACGSQISQSVTIYTIPYTINIGCYGSWTAYELPIVVPYGYGTYYSLPATVNYPYWYNYGCYSKSGLDCDSTCASYGLYCPTNYAYLSGKCTTGATFCTKQTAASCYCMTY